MSENDEGIETADMRLLNIKQVSDILNLSYNGTYKLINSGQIKSVKIGTRRLFTRKTIKEYIASLEEAYAA